MRIVLFILGAVAVIYLMVKGFKQVLQEAREQHSADQPQPPAPPIQYQEQDERRTRTHQSDQDEH